MVIAISVLSIAFGLLVLDYAFRLWGMEAYAADEDAIDKVIEVVGKTKAHKAIFAYKTGDRTHYLRFTVESHSGPFTGINAKGEVVDESIIKIYHDGKPIYRAVKTFMVGTTRVFHDNDHAVPEGLNWRDVIATYDALCDGECYAGTWDEDKNKFVAE